jgi:signal transduction histidine kinase
MLFLAAALVIGLLLLRTLLHRDLDQDVARELNQEVTEFGRFASGDNPTTGEPFRGDVRAMFDLFLRQNVPSEGEALFTLLGGQPYASTLSPVQLLDDKGLVRRWRELTSTARGSTRTIAGEARWVALPLVGEDGETAGVFVAATFVARREDALDSALRTGALIFGASFLAASGLAWFAAGRVLRPLRMLTDTARQVRQDSWRRRIDVRGDDDITELTRTFNAMLDRLEDAFTTQRRFLDDASHELKTPITIVRGHLEILALESGQHGDTVALVTDELDRMARMVDDLLLLARSESPAFLDLDTVDAAGLLRDVASKVTALADRPWSFDGGPAVNLVGDRQRLTQAMMNLVTNALRYTPEGTAITIGGRVEGHRYSFYVRDDGPGIAPEERDRLFERFARGASSRGRDGAGLGLAIVKAVAEAHGGNATLVSEAGRGAEFAISIPLEEDPPV